ncbi:MAG TPA: hypothetical protein VJM82_00160 [Nitrospiraceae bacterium]|nr:hypothetical protein [Nitrospiraceae bacterium]
MDTDREKELSPITADWFAWKAVVKRAFTEHPSKKNRKGEPLLVFRAVVRQLYLTAKHDIPGPHRLRVTRTFRCGMVSYTISGLLQPEKPPIRLRPDTEVWELLEPRVSEAVLLKWLRRRVIDPHAALDALVHMLLPAQCR